MEKVINSVLKIFDNDTLIRLSYTILGILIGMLSILYMSNWGESVLNAAKAIGTFLIAISIILTASQFLYNRQWNKKDVAIKTLHQSNDLLSQYRDILDPHLQIFCNIEQRSILPIYEIHNAMGVFLDNGKFVYHGEETQEDVKHIQTIHHRYAQQFKKDIKGRDVDIAIRKILNEFEYLSLGCERGIFDKQTVIELKGPSFFLYFNLFSNYIYHLRYDQRHNYGNTLYEYFEKFSKECLDYYKTKADIFSSTHLHVPMPNDYKTPFQPIPDSPLC